MDTTIETIENRWDILYRDYPHIYDEFASMPYEPPVLSVVIEEFGLGGKTVADVGCGSGRSALTLAETATKVFGVEPEVAMLELARSRAKELGVRNVEYLEGTAQTIPLPDKSVDAVTAVTTVFYPPGETLPAFIAEARRIVKPGGIALLINIAPGWYGGDLHDVIEDKSPDLVEMDELLKSAEFEYRDIDTMQSYGTVENMVRTYGFIFGRSAINYIKHNRKTQVLWRNRIRFKVFD